MVIGRSFDSASAQYFAPVNNGRNQLQGVAIGGRHLAASFNVCLSDEDKHAVAHQLVRHTNIPSLY